MGRPELVSMLGPEIIARSMTAQRILDKHGNHWQYHPRSDRHSKIACWSIMFDLMRSCALMRKHATEGRIGFGVNHEMVDFTNDRKKSLDLVVSFPRAVDEPPETMTLVDLATEYRIVLTAEERQELASLPRIERRPVGDVLLAVEAKACMTAHQRAGPRLYDELTSAWGCINGSSPHAIAVGFGMVNASAEFISPDRNRARIVQGDRRVNQERQPHSTEITLRRLRSIRVRGHVTERGFDAVGILTVFARNDFSAITLAPPPLSPSPEDPHNYERMILRVAGLYDGRFAAR